MGCGCGGGGGGGGCSCPGGGEVIPRAGREIVFFRKHTALCGNEAGVTYYSDPVDVAEWKTLALEVGFKAESSGDGAVEGHLETSSDPTDPLAWVDYSGPLILLAPGITIRGAFPNSARYVRLALEVSVETGENIVVVWGNATPKER